MKPNQLITTMLATTALFVVSCSTPKLAQNKAIQDDVYNTTAKAKEYIAPIVIQPTTVENTDEYYSTSDPYYDMDYSSRIDRFYYGNPNRPYYDPSYNYYGYNSFGFDPYGYNSFYRPFNYGFGLGGYFGSFYNNWNNPYYNWGYYGSMHYNNFWGPYSYYDRYGYGGGWGGWNGGGWGGGVIVRNNENYRPRPNRSSEGMVRPGGRYNGSTPSRGNVNTGIGRPTRAENYNPSANRADRSSNSSGSSRPTRTTESRPTTTRESYSPPARSSSPPASSSGSGSSSSGGGSRPTRGGGRG